MPYLKDRVKDSTTTTGTGNLTVSGTAPTGFVDFNTAYGLNTRFPYVVSSSGGSEWECGIGYLSGTTTLVRDTITASSNSGNAVNFSAGTKDVYVDITAEIIEDVSAGRIYAMSRGMAMP